MASMATSLLTPSKIARAFLIRFYCNGFVPPELELTVLQLLISHIDLGSKSTSTRQPRAKTDAGQKSSLIGKNAEALRSAFKAHVATLKLSKGEDLNVWNNYEEQLCSIRSLDTLLDEIKRLKALFPDADTDGGTEATTAAEATSKPKHLLSRDSELVGAHRLTKLTRWSVLGIFIHRIMLEFEKLSFDDAMRVWRSFKVYRQPLMESLSGKHAVLHESEEFNFMDMQSGGRISTIINDFLLDTSGDSREASSADAEKILEFQIHLMQKHGTKITPEMRSQIEETLNSKAKNNNLYNFLSFLQARFEGDKTSSLDALHRYFDYAMQHTDRSHYQYALLNMAILQSEFGSFDEVASAMKETISTARENKDIHCLNYCLSWLYHFCNNHGEESSKIVRDVLQAADGDQGHRYLRAAAREDGMPHVETQVLLLEARQSLAKGHRPLEALEKTYEASYLTLNHSFEGIAASLVLFQSSLYARLGVPHLSKALTNLVVECFPTNVSQQETIQARCRNAYFDALGGKYKAALDALDGLKKLDLSNSLNQLLAQYSGVIKLKRTLHHNDLAEAELLIAALKSGTSLDVDLAFVVSLHEIELLSRYGNLPEALSMAEAMSQKYDDQPQTDTYQQMKLLNTKTFLFAEAGRAQKGFSIALRSASAAYRAKNAMVLWESVAALAGVLVGIQEWEAAAAITGSAVYRAMEIEDLAVVARIRKIGVDALVGQAGATKDQEDRRKLIVLASEWITEAGNLYRLLEDYKGRNEMNTKARMLLKYLGHQGGEPVMKDLEREGDEIKALMRT